MVPTAFLPKVFVFLTSLSCWLEGKSVTMFCYFFHVLFFCHLFVESTFSCEKPSSLQNPKLYLKLLFFSLQCFCFKWNSIVKACAHQWKLVWSSWSATGVTLKWFPNQWLTLHLYCKLELSGKPHSTLILLNIIKFKQSKAFHCPWIGER